MIATGCPAVPRHVARTKIARYAEGVSKGSTLRDIMSDNDALTVAHEVAEHVPRLGVRTGVLLAVALSVLLGPIPGSSQARWIPALVDGGTDRWADRWLLSGDPDRGITVTNGPEGMTLRAGDGTDPRKDHAVLWTRAIFSGDVRIEYDYVVLDRYPTPIGEGGYCSAVLIHSRVASSAPLPADIGNWSSEQRNSDTSGPALNAVIDGLQLNYAFVGDPRGNPFRLRSNPGYRLVGESAGVPVFEVGTEYHLVIEKVATTVSIAANPPTGLSVSHSFASPEIGQHLYGRIGLRNMNHREARYRNIRISQRPAAR